MRYYLYRKIKKMPPFVEFNEEQRLFMGDKKTLEDYDPLALADFAREHNIDAYTLMYFHNYNHKPVIRYRCESLHEFLELELNKLIEYGVNLKRCERCGQFFTVKGNYDARYCNRIHPGEVRSCRDLAAEENYKNKMAEDKAIPIYRKYYRRYSARVKVNQIKQRTLRNGNTQPSPSATIAPTAKSRLRNTSTGTRRIFPTASVRTSKPHTDRKSAPLAATNRQRPIYGSFCYTNTAKAQNPTQPISRDL